MSTYKWRKTLEKKKVKEKKWVLKPCDTLNYNTNKQTNRHYLLVAFYHTKENSIQLPYQKWIEFILNKMWYRLLEKDSALLKKLKKTE